MSPEQWREARQIFEDALDKEPAERQAFVRESCKGDQRLFEEVASLLASYDQADDFLQPVIEGVSQTDRFEGRQVGNYRILHRLGQGGMGAVYLAERSDDQFRRRVAIKLVRPGYDDGQLLRRFSNERQLLAVLDHPNIVKLLDAGVTSDGIPYFVMDYVEGQPIDQYCESRGLSIPERLQLFRSVCDAVHCAHRNLVVHRDLKPGNILVTPEGKPMLLDFGIAKLLRPEYGAVAIGLTRTLQPMTAEFASPEQVSGQPITTSSDVYSLGVLLYRLITGRHPYTLNTNSAADVERVICETNPARPSTVAVSGPARKARARTDLDNIVLMAMRKEPQRRYASVEHLSEDIRRYLASEPIAARKDTALYRASKFVRRHPFGVTSAVLTALALMASTGIAFHERDLAQAELDDLRKTAAFMLFDLDDELLHHGLTPGRKMLMTKALEQLDKLSVQVGRDEALTRQIVLGYLKVGNVLGLPSVANLGQFREARLSYQKALQLASTMKPGTRTSALIVESQNALGRWDAFYGSPQEAEKHFAAALDASANLTDAKIGQLIVMEQKGQLAEKRADFVAAAQSYAASLELARKLQLEKPSELRRSNLQRETFLYGIALARTGHIEESLKQLNDSLAIEQTSGSTSPVSRRNEGSAYGGLGFVYALADRNNESIDAYRRSIAIFQQLAQSDRHNDQARADLGQMKGEIARPLAAAKLTREAAQSIEECLDILGPVVNQQDAIAVNLQQYADFLLAPSAHADPAAAVLYAKRADDQENHTNPATLEILAHAYAASGDLQRAHRTAAAGLALLPATGVDDLRAKLGRWQSAQTPPR